MMVRRARACMLVMVALGAFIFVGVARATPVQLDPANIPSHQYWNGCLNAGCTSTTYDPARFTPDGTPPALPGPFGNYTAINTDLIAHLVAVPSPGPLKVSLDVTANRAATAYLSVNGALQSTTPIPANATEAWADLPGATVAQGDDVSVKIHTSSTGGTARFVLHTIHGELGWAVSASDSFVNAPLPDNVLLDTQFNPNAGQAIAAQVASYGTGLNYKSFTTPLTVVPASQPLVPFGCTGGCGKQMAAVVEGVDVSTGQTDLHGGLPFPADYVFPTDSDDEVALVQPDYVNPCTGWHGRYYEAFGVRKNTTGWKDSWGVTHPAYDSGQPVSSPGNVPYLSSSGGRAQDLPNNPGHYHGHGRFDCGYSTPGAPDSSWEAAGIGVLAAQTFIANDEVRRDDCATQTIDHSIGLLLHNAHPGFVWPAQHGDGYDSTTAVQEGTRLRFAPDTVMPSGMTRLAQMLWHAAHDYGLVVDDITAASTGVRLEPITNGTPDPACMALLDGKAPWQSLAGFPWGQLQTIAVGSDSNPDPTG